MAADVASEDFGTVVKKKLIDLLGEFATLHYPGWHLDLNFKSPRTNQMFTIRISQVRHAVWYCLMFL